MTSPHVQGANACACAFVGVGSVYYTPLHESPVPKPWPEAAFNPCHTVPHTVAAAALSFEDETKYVAVITAAATAVLTWSEYRKHGQKLISFSTAVHALQSRIMWWHSLRPAEQTPSKFKDLVLTSEQIIQNVGPLGTLALHELASGGKEAEGTAPDKGAIAADKAAIADGKAAIEADNYPVASTNPQAKMLALEFNKKAQGLYTDAKEAREVHLISTPFDHVAGAALACEVKARINNPDTFVVCINPNTDIGEIASDRGWSKEVQEKKWLEVFMGLLRIAQNRKERGSKVHIICRNNKPCDPDAGDTPELVGNAQRGELLAALIAGFNEDDKSMVYEIF